MAPRRILALAVLCLGVVYAMVYADLVLRARSAYDEGEKYLLWAREPQLKKSYYDKTLAAEDARIQKEFKAGGISRDDLQERLALAQVRHDDALSQSSLKYAYVWFQTACELFSPPESRWVVLSREEMARTKALWKKELQAKKIPYKDYMLE